MSLNGNLPDSWLGTIPDAGGRRLLAQLVPQTAALREAFAEHFGKSLYITDAYRDYATQVYLKRIKGPYAATPGTSNHGWGRAIDFGSGVHTSFTSPEHLWMRDNAPQFGWFHPTWAHDHYPGNGQDEPWHFEASEVAVPASNYASTTGAIPTAPDLTIPEPLEDDMQQLILVQSGGALWLGDGITRRQIQSMDEVDDIKYQLPLGRIEVIDRGEVARIDWLGVNVTADAGRLERIEWAAVGAKPQPVDARALAEALAPLLSKATGVGVTVAQVQAAAEQAVRTVLHDGVG